MFRRVPSGKQHVQERVGHHHDERVQEKSRKRPAASQNRGPTEKERHLAIQIKQLQKELKQARAASSSSSGLQVHDAYLFLMEKILKAIEAGFATPTVSATHVKEWKFLDVSGTYVNVCAIIVGVLNAMSDPISFVIPSVGVTLAHTDTSVKVLLDSGTVVPLYDGLGFFGDVVTYDPVNDQLVKTGGNTVRSFSTKIVIDLTDGLAATHITTTSNDFMKGVIYCYQIRQDWDRLLLAGVAVHVSGTPICLLHRRLLSMLSRSRRTFTFLRQQLVLA